MWHTLDFNWGGAASSEDGSQSFVPRALLALEDGDVDPDQPEPEAEEDDYPVDGEDEDSQSVTTTQPEQSREGDEFDMVPPPNADVQDEWEFKTIIFRMVSTLTFVFVLKLLGYTIKYHMFWGKTFVLTIA